MDFETFKKTKLGSSGLCPKCEKHFDRLRTHANSCLKNDFESYFSLPNAANTTCIKESKSIQDIKMNFVSENKKQQSTSDLKSIGLKKTKSDEEIKVRKCESTGDLNKCDSNDGIVSKIKVQDKSKVDRLEEIKFQEFYETVIDKLKNQSLNDASCQYRFDFVKLRCDVKPIKPLIDSSDKENFDRHDVFSHEIKAKSINAKATPKITPVLLVSNLNTESVTIDALFILFGVYGDVQRIKMIDKKLCYIEFTNKEQAETALRYLDDCKLWNKEIKIYQSGYESISSSNEAGERNSITKDFTNSHLHRFRYRKPDMPLYLNKPSATLHLSNIPSNVTTNELNYLFERCGRVIKTRLNSNQGNGQNYKGLVQMSSIDEGILALITNHGKQLNRNVYLRCNFHNRNLENH